ncbi:hypothetical protein [Pseudovibrio sp. Tun.PSC04-5.I4]|uniref:hypothetical protein n=1 Tax=Pseudovibrio sp. Tun.PSC04-5.I4 TaxID=1798213 RepID=UPI00088A0EAC|nr:hypothetical protein [Pseudovibrio sp. Tun.PSC04-5.I4]SDR15134.1 hypothetical protein SAMN04515695_3036 [Pseudovibrio sp. Tun.PSC04-5.I4]
MVSSVGPSASNAPIQPPVEPDGEGEAPQAQSPSEVNVASAQAEAPNPADSQTSIWGSFLSNLPAVDPDFENPLLSIPGTQAYSSDPTRYNAFVARVLVDPATTVADEDLPNNFSNPTPQQFLSWHPSVQLRYFRDNFSEEDIRNGNTKIGSGSDEIGIIRSDDKRDIIVVNNLTQSTIAQLSTSEQERLAASDIFRSKVAPLLDLLPNATTSLSDSRTVITGLIDAEIAKINNKPLNNKTSSSDRQTFNSDKQVYIEQLELFKANISTTAVFSRSGLATQLQEVIKRFERAHSFFDVPTPSSTSPAGSARNFVSSDGNVSINKGYRVFIEQEQRILSIKEAELQMLQLQGIAGTDSNGNSIVSRLDVPTLVALIQNQNSLKLQAVITMRTEQLTQLNQLSQAYSEMQRLVNETLKSFTQTGKDAEKEKHSLAVNLGSASQFTKSVFFMFEDVASGAPHPVETDFNATRPSHDMLNNGNGNLNEFSRTQWERFSTQLSDAVTLLNPQLLTNDINQDNREQNRAFEQATGTVRRGFDLNIQIARGFN